VVIGGRTDAVNRRRLLWSAVTLPQAGGALAVAFDAGLFTRSLESRLRSVRVGMTLADVEAVMGRPPDLFVVESFQGG
jgi:hypothetical protein